MALHTRAILFLCICGYVSAQYSEVDIPPQRTGTTSKPRYQKLQNPRLSNGPQLQPIGGAARPRRPIPLSRPRPLPTSDGPGFPAFTNARPRPVFISPLAVKSANIPTAAQERQQQQTQQENQQQQQRQQQQQEKQSQQQQRQQDQQQQRQQEKQSQQQQRQQEQQQQQQRQQEKQQQQQSVIKPVSEDTEEEEEDVAQAIANLGAVSSFAQQSGNLVGGPLTPKPDLGLGQFRGASPSPTPPSRPAPLPEQNPAPVQYRPQKPYKLRKPIIEEVPEVRITARQQHHQQPQPPVRSPSKTSEIRDKYSESPRDNFSETRAKFAEPARDKYVGTREKKPVAQIIRRWREDNPDGSITWGFENDDGSYKEELIGIDCITRGKYGYVDLDGFRREYTYETGIKCDEEQQEEERENGFVDYQENKLVLPNGKTIDLSSMGKKQARRPGPIYN